MLAVHYSSGPLDADVQAYRQTILAAESVLASCCKIQTAHLTLNEPPCLQFQIEDAGETYADETICYYARILSQGRHKGLEELTMSK